MTHHTRIFGVGATNPMLPDVAMFTFERGPRGGLYATGYVACDKAELQKPVPRKPLIEDGWVEVKPDTSLNRALGMVRDEYPGLWAVVTYAPVPVFTGRRALKGVKPPLSTKDGLRASKVKPRAKATKPKAKKKTK